ncbi:hypothetical protein FHX41_3410 [Actinomadura hallensis]|uniref:Uncharacterized protein n=1 Tax=Actinomadura hallensis TaxID=337895 RepID=A0A543IGK2_9ACTN|nr:hypothetical protein FHX41_3410 [Actinomadura hallensis]
MTRRLLLSYLSLTVVVLLGLEITLGAVFTRRQVSDFPASVQRDAVMVAELIEKDLSAGNPAGVTEIVTHYTDCMGGRVVVFDRAGRIVTDSAAGGLAAPARNGPRGGDGDEKVGRAVSAALRDHPTVGTIRDRAGGEELMSAAQPVTVASKVQGAERCGSPRRPRTPHPHPDRLDRTGLHRRRRAPSRDRDRLRARTLDHPAPGRPGAGDRTAGRRFPHRPSGRGPGPARTPPPGRLLQPHRHPAAASPACPARLRRRSVRPAQKPPHRAAPPAGDARVRPRAPRLRHPRRGHRRDRQAQRHGPGPARLGCGVQGRCGHGVWVASCSATYRAGSLTLSGIEKVAAPP